MRKKWGKNRPAATGASTAGEVNAPEDKKLREHIFNANQVASGNRLWQCPNLPMERGL
jgi:hypothetical protein